MATIPASQLVQILPNVLSAGGNALVMTGLMLTSNTRVPMGQVLSFPNDGASVSTYFGASATETALSAIYFNGYNNSTQKPAALYFAQYNPASVAAYLRGAAVNGLSITQLRALSGSLSVVVDGYTFSAASVDLSPSTSYSAAATIIQTALNTTLPSAASFTGAIAPGAASVTGSIAGNVLTVSAVSSGMLVNGAIISGTGVTAGTQIDAQLSGTAGGVGTYAVSATQTVASTTISASYGTLTVSAVASGTLSVGQTVAGGTTLANTHITALGTGTGLTGTYIVDLTQTVTSGSLTSTGTALAVSYDSVSGGFVITSGIRGTASTIAYATGTLAPLVYLTSATGAVLSQGAAPATPSAFMTAITQITQNWGTFMTLFDPDNGAATAQKVAFSTWVNSQNKRYAYIAWDQDVTPTASNNATSSFGNIVQAANYDGTCAIWGPTDKAAFVCGAAASIDFNATNGRITFAFRGQDGLTADVTNATVASNLIANGYNFYGAYATANQQFLEFQPGQVTGQFDWLDSYINQIYLNSQLQLALMELLQNTNSIPYNNAGYALIKAACADPINQALNFGSIRAGVTLSAQQAAQINSAAGVKVSDTLQLQGWYLQVNDATPQVRQARQSPSILFWYVDGQSVQKIVLTSTLVK